ncbi:hypothetical protein [Tahibacter caeni]|uniref:hypothetical protein n=1 Tax=Tahibacter caeni TaxID=1453545 RepID=UPI00214826CF|nr:hypothetical protein [Tahibacter caeni]
MSTYDDIQSSPEVVLCSFVAPPPPLCLGVRENAFVSTDYYRADEPRLRWQVDRIDGNGNIAIWVSGQPRVLVASMSDGSLSLRDKSEEGTLSYATDEIWNVVTPDLSASARHALEATIGVSVLIPFLLGGVQQPGVQTGGPVAVRPNFDYDRNLNILGNGPYGPGDTVAAWDGWGGGDPNEIWFFTTPEILAQLNAPASAAVATSLGGEEPCSG